MAENRSLMQYFTLMLKGMAMGAADAVPGVSGGTIAFISGIYEELLHSLKSLTPAALDTWYREGFAAFWRAINGGFLLSVFGGILLSLKIFAALITYLLSHYPILVWAFFFGLVLASIVYFAFNHRGWQWSEYLACLLGVLAVLVLSALTPAQAPDQWWMLFAGGFIAICAMILPGVSGSFLLLLLGLYSVFMDAINAFKLLSLASFGVGCIAGLLVFSRFLSWLLDRYHSITLAVLVGFLIGSLKVIWPWKITLEVTLDRHGEEIPLVQESVLPWTYAQATGSESHTFLVLICCTLGFLLVLFVEKISQKKPI